MVNIFAIGVVLLTLVTITDGRFVNCTEPKHHLRPCAFGSICAWNKCHCSQGKQDCHLVCQKSIRQWCNGLSEGDRCLHREPQYECMKCGRKLMCLFNPLGPVCEREKLYYVGETYIGSSSGFLCICQENGGFQCQP